MKQDISNVGLEAQATDNFQREYRIKVEIFIFEDRPGVFVAFCPSLDLSTSSDSFNGAISAFYEALQLHVEYCVENGTLIKDLFAHGWSIVGGSLRPPKFDYIIKSSSLSNLVNSDRSYERIVSPVRVPAAL